MTPCCRAPMCAPCLCGVWALSGTCPACSEPSGFDPAKVTTDIGALETTLIGTYARGGLLVFVKGLVGVWAMRGDGSLARVNDSGGLYAAYCTWRPME